MTTTPPGKDGAVLPRGRSGPQCCLICQGTEFDEIVRYVAPDQYEQDAGISPENYYRAWVRCTDCQFIYSRYDRDAGAIDRLYRRDYRAGQSNFRRQGTTREIFEKVIALPPAESETYARIGWIKKEIQELERAGYAALPAAPDGKRLMLDIGGATGVFAYLFKDTEWDAEVIDPAETGSFVEEFGVRYHQRAYAAGATRSPVDLAAMVFVLEHLREPREILSLIGADLASGGLIYIEVPDASAFRLKAPEDDIFNSCHLWMFEPLSLTRLLAECGIEVLTLRRTKNRRGHLALSVLASRHRPVVDTRPSTM